MESAIYKATSAITSWLIAQIILWSIAVAAIVLSWNYLIASFFGLDLITIPVAVGILLIKNALLLHSNATPK
jgi:predicted secreted protein